MKKADFIAGLLIGAAAGAAITFLFGTEEGKELRARLLNEAWELEKELRADFERIFENEEVEAGA